MSSYKYQVISVYFLNASKLTVAESMHPDLQMNDLSKSVGESINKSRCHA